MKANQENNIPIIVLDANAFISGENLLHLVTSPEVMEQLRDEKTRENIQKFPFSIQKLNFDESSLAAVKSFARKTGDIGSLSEVDLELLALVHTLYSRHGLAENLKKNPPPMRQQQPNEVEQEQQEQSQEQQEEDESSNDSGEWITVPKSKPKPVENVEEDMDDEEGWVTPQNFETKMAEGGGFYDDKIEAPENEQKEEGKIISLMTADYAMQNVASQMGMKLLSLDGRKIKEIRRFIWECYLCWKQYNITDNKVHLCKDCGYNSLSKIAYTINEKGQMILHRKKNWQPNKNVLEWKEKKYEQQQKRKKNQYPRRKKQQSIFDTA